MNARMTALLRNSIVTCFLSILFISCNKEKFPPTDFNQKNPQSSALRLSNSKTDKLYDANSTLKREFGKSLVKAIAESKSFRALLKSKALEMMNEDYEVLYEMIEDERLENGTKVKDLIEKHLVDKKLIQRLKEIYPTLTILVPSLPQNSFNAENWNVDTQIPKIAIRLLTSNDVPIINLDGTENVLEGKYTPGFPVLVIKENERIIDEKHSSYKNLDSRVLESKNGRKFKFISDSFDRKLKKNKRLTTAANIDPKLIQAYNTYQSTSGWHRDLIYYNITPTNTKGPFDYSFKDGLKSFTMVGDANAALQKISDQTGDPTINAVISGGASQWSGGSFEFKVTCLINARNGVGAELVTYFPAMPSDLFELTYTKIANNIFGPDVYGLVGVSLKKMPLNIPILNWDLNSYASSIKISIEEVDVVTTETKTESISVKFANNFAIDGGILQKIGLKLGASMESVQSQSYQHSYTLGNDQLGEVIVNFADNVITGEIFSNIYETREYTTGYYSISFEPIKVQ